VTEGKAKPKLNMGESREDRKGTGIAFRGTKKHSLRKKGRSTSSSATGDNRRGKQGFEAIRLRAD